MNSRLSVETTPISSAHLTAGSVLSVVVADKLAGSEEHPVSMDMIKTEEMMVFVIFLFISLPPEILIIYRQYVIT